MGCLFTLQHYATHRFVMCQVYWHWLPALPCISALRVGKDPQTKLAGYHSADVLARPL